MLNAYFPVLRGDKPGDLELAKFMVERSELSNLLAEKISNENLDRVRKPWIRISELDLQDFPLLSLDDLQSITVGIYQLRNARSYLARGREAALRKILKHIIRYAG
jgi:hypothetical protein